MLIRLVDHFRDNPKRIDKLIAIKGLPRDWVFNDVKDDHGGLTGEVNLKRPWEPDIDANIPFQIRNLCDPMYITFRYSPFEKGAPGVVERKQVLGIKIDYNTEPGRDMWDRVERYIEETIPRDERVPVPVVCAKDERSPFETYTPRRTRTGSLEFVASSVPEVDLNRYTVQKTVVEPTVIPSRPEPTTPPPIHTPETKTVEFKCEECSYVHKSERGVRMHKMKAHPKVKAVA